MQAEMTVDQDQTGVLGQLVETRHIPAERPLGDPVGRRVVVVGACPGHVQVGEGIEEPLGERHAGAVAEEGVRHVGRIRRVPEPVVDGREEDRGGQGHRRDLEPVREAQEAVGREGLAEEEVEALLLRQEGLHLRRGQDRLAGLQANGVDHVEVRDWSQMLHLWGRKESVQ